MITDDNWHPAILVKLKDGNFALFDNLKEAQASNLDFGAEVHYQDVKVNYNHGQPIMDTGDFKVSIVDMDIRQT